MKPEKKKDEPKKQEEAPKEEGEEEPKKAKKESESFMSLQWMDKVNFNFKDPKQ